MVYQLVGSILIDHTQMLNLMICIDPLCMSRPRLLQGINERKFIQETPTPGGWPDGVVRGSFGNEHRQLPITLIPQNPKETPSLSGHPILPLFLPLHVLRVLCGKSFPTNH